MYTLFPFLNITGTPSTGTANTSWAKVSTTTAHTVAIITNQDSTVQIEVAFVMAGGTAPSGATATAFYVPGYNSVVLPFANAFDVYVRTASSTANYRYTECGQ